MKLDTSPAVLLVFQVYILNGSQHNHIDLLLKKVSASFRLSRNESCPSSFFPIRLMFCCSDDNHASIILKSFPAYKLRLGRVGYFKNYDC